MLFPVFLGFPSGRLPRNFHTEQKIAGLSYTFSFPQFFTIPARLKLPDFTILTFLVEVRQVPHKVPDVQNCTLIRTSKHIPGFGIFQRPLITYRPLD
jgi:hypothetical protein